MKERIQENRSDFAKWLVEERFQILTTLFAAILPTLLTAIWQQGNNSLMHSFVTVFTENSNLLQAIFIFITLFVLVKHMIRTNSILENLKEYIANYVEENVAKKYRSDKEKYYTHGIVSATVKQFYVVWIAVWIFWFIYYFGNWIFGHEDTTSIRTFNLVFDFLSSTCIYIIYLILTDVTVKIEERAKGRLQLWYGFLFWIIIFAVWLSLIVRIYTDSDISETLYQYNNLLMSVFSALSFVLVLGKMNSNYLQIPRFFLLGMYVYAVFQAYVPFAGIENPSSLAKIGYLIDQVVPYATLIGKVIVMLALCWIAGKKRLIFFIIHESVAMDETPALLDELDSDPVEF